MNAVISAVVRTSCLLVLLASSLLQAQDPASGVVQVALSYGPHQEAYLSGVVVGDGRIVLSDSGVLPRVRDISIAFSDKEVLDVIIAQIQTPTRVAILPMTVRHGKPVEIAPLGREAAPSQAIDVTAGSSPKPFELDQRSVRITPLGSGSSLRWQISTPLPAYFRGGPLLDSKGQLVAIIIQDQGALVGMPLGDLLPIIDAAAGRPPMAAPPKPQTQPTPEPVGPATPPVHTQMESTSPDPAVTSVLKDTAIGAIRLEPKDTSKTASSANAPRTASDFKLPLRAIRTAWAWNPPKVGPSTAVAKGEQPTRTVAEAPDTKAPDPKAPDPKVTKAASKPPAAVDTPAAAAPVLDVQEYLRKYSDYLQQKDYNKAVEILEEGVQKHPDANNLYFQLALAYWYKASHKQDGTMRSSMEKASYHKAIKSFETFLQKAPNDPMANDARMRLSVLRNAARGGGE